MVWSRVGSWLDDPFLMGFGGLRNIQEEMNRLFDGAAGDTTSGYPPLNIMANAERVVVSAELPGVELKDLDLSVSGSTLTLHGSRPATELENGARLYRNERLFGEFSRTIELPFAVDGDAVNAEYKNGILSVSLPRAKQDLPKKITIR